MRRGSGVAAMAAAFLTLATGASAGELTVGSGASVDLGTGSLDLGCADLTVAGTLSVGTSGFAQARDVTVDPAGVLNGNSATLQVAGDWDNAGTFNAGTSTVQLVDGCGLASAVIAGDTTFANLDMTTTSGFLYSFISGTTQTVTSPHEPRTGCACGTKAGLPPIPRPRTGPTSARTHGAKLNRLR